MKPGAVSVSRPEGRGKDGAGLGLAGYCDYCDRDMGDGPDACLGLIPGVSHACCGHGVVEDAYVVLGGPENVDADCETYRNLTLRGTVANAFFALIKCGEIAEPKTLEGASGMLSSHPTEAPDEPS